MMIFLQEPLVCPAVLLSEETTPHGRWYKTPSGKRYASVTTVLNATAPDKAGLREWRKRVGEAEATRITQQAAGEGTRVHAALEKIIQNQWSSFQAAQVMPNVKALLNQMLPVMEAHVTAVHASELALYSDRLRLAGRTDCICSWNGVRTILDFKRSNRPKSFAMVQDYFLQTTAYALMAEELLGVDIPTITILMGVADGSGPLFWHLEKDKYIEILMARLARYQELTLA